MMAPIEIFKFYKRKYNSLQMCVNAYSSSFPCRLIIAQTPIKLIINIFIGITSRLLFFSLHHPISSRRHPLKVYFLRQIIISLSSPTLDWTQTETGEKKKVRPAQDHLKRRWGLTPRVVIIDDSLKGPRGLPQFAVCWR